MHNGYISLHRKFKENPIYSDSQAVHLWIHILILANHKDNQFVFNGSLVSVKRGQLITGRRSLEEQTGISESKIQRLLKLFEELKMIEQQMNSKSRLISITNYHLYQSSEQQTNSKRTAREQHVNTNNNDNNDNKLKLSSPDDVIDAEKPADTIPYQQIVDLFNATCISLPAAMLLTTKRKTLIKSVYKMSKDHQEIEFWRWLFEKVEASNFLAGRETAWKASFDWALNSTNFVKIIEGNYDGK